MIKPIFFLNKISKREYFKFERVLQKKNLWEQDWRKFKLYSKFWLITYECPFTVSWTREILLYNFDFAVNTRNEVELNAIVELRKNFWGNQNISQFQVAGQLFFK
jgi:hypothetical protein